MCVWITANSNTRVLLVIPVPVWLWGAGAASNPLTPRECRAHRDRATAHPPQCPPSDLSPPPPLRRAAGTERAPPCTTRGAARTYVKNTASQGSANGSASGRPEAPKFGQLAGRSVVNIPSDYHLFSFYSLKPALGCCHSFLAPLCGRGSRDVGRTRFGNRARVVGLARSPRMQTPSPTTKLLAGMLASEQQSRSRLTEAATC